MKKVPPSGILLTQTRRPNPYEMSYWKTQGYTVFYQSLLKVTPLPVEPLDIDPQAIVLTSGNAASALEDSDWDRTIPVFGVGRATAQMAKAAGFTDCSSPSNKPYPSAINLLNWIINTLEPEAGPIVFGCGREVRHDLAQDLKIAGYTTKKVILYNTQPIDTFSKNIEIGLKNGSIDTVVLQSEQAIKGFATLCHKNSIAYQDIILNVPSDHLKLSAAALGFLNIKHNHKSPHAQRGLQKTIKNY
jgi:uroporphyrinogen-III synthase